MPLSPTKYPSLNNWPWLLATTLLQWTLEAIIFFLSLMETAVTGVNRLVHRHSQKIEGFAKSNLS